MTAPLRVDRPADGVLRLTLARPERRNALDRRLIDALADRLREVAADREHRVVVLAGDGAGFCAGLDVRHHGYEEQIATRGVAGLLAAQQAVSALVRQLRELPQPVVAAVQGAAVGAGFALTLAADLRLAADDARFAVGTMAIGLAGTDVGISWLLPRIVGAGRSAEWVLTGRAVPAEEARDAGLVARVVAGADLAAAAVETAAAVAAHDDLALRLTKRTMWANLGTSQLATALELEDLTQVLAGLRRAELAGPPP